jgi:hypothetical protein
MSLALEQIVHPALCEPLFKMIKCSVVLGSEGQFGGVLPSWLLCKLSQLTLELSLFLLRTSILYPAPRHSRTAP